MLAQAAHDAEIVNAAHQLHQIHKVADISHVTSEGIEVSNASPAVTSTLGYALGVTEAEKFLADAEAANKSEEFVAAQKYLQTLGTKSPEEITAITEQYKKIHGVDEEDTTRKRVVFMQEVANKKSPHPQEEKDGES